MGIKIQGKVIEREFYDEFCGQDFWMEHIVVNFNSVTGSGYIEQEGQVISFTKNQLQELAKILEVMKHA